MAGIASAPTTYPFTGSIPEQFGIIKADDGTDLFYRYWPSRNLPSKIVVVVLHGIGMHSGPYVTVAAALTPLGIDVYGLDDRGHGKSSGSRDRLGPISKTVADIHSLIQFVSQINEPEIFLLGESMGGPLALSYAFSHEEFLSGLILVAPALRLCRRQIFRALTITLLPYLLAPTLPSVNLLDRRLEESSRDQRFIDARRSDDLSYSKVSLRYIFNIKTFILHCRASHLRSLQKPILLLHGGSDRLISIGGSQTLARKIRYNTFKIYKSAWHTLFWDPETPLVLEGIGKWVAQQSKGSLTLAISV